MAQFPDKSIKVLYIHGVAQIGGAERELLSWLEFLDRKRFEPYVVCPSNGPLIAELEKLNIPHISFSFPAWRKLFHICLRPFAVFRLMSIIRRLNIDLLHVNDYWWAPLGILAGRITGRPCLIHVRQEIEPRKVSQYWLDRGSLVVPVSKSIGNVLKDTGVSQKNIQVLLSGVGSKKKPTFPLPSETLEVLQQIKGQPIIGTVANLFPRKGLQYLVEAIGQVKESFSNVFLVIVGTGDAEYERHLRSKVESLGLTNQVLFAGFQANPEIFISQFDVFVLPSVLEGLGIVLLEAMTLGKPIVATNVGGIPEIVQHEKTGLLVKPADVDDLYRGLITLCQDPAICQRMGEEAKKRVAETFSRTSMMEGLYHLYKSRLVIC